MEVVSAARAKESFMMYRLAVVIIPVLLLGCGSPPDENKKEQVPAEYGFFSDLPQFTDVTEIHRIGTQPDRPVAGLDRLNKRYGPIIEHHRDRIKDARIVDFGSYDGRWAYAMADAGAKHVTGIEINKDYAVQAGKNMEELGISADRYDFIVGDVLEELRNTEPGSYDGVMCAGLYYHITYHVEMLKELKRIGVKWIIMDTAITSDEKGTVTWAIGPNGLEGIPSRSAIEMIADETDFQIEYVPTDHLQGPGTWDYQMGGRIIMTLF
jgi:predicted O-methyltransferase YrrM